MDEIAYKLPPGMRELAYIWETQESAIRRHLLDIDLSNPYTYNNKHRISQFKNIPKNTTYTQSTITTHEIMPKEKIIDIEHDEIEVPIEKPIFHTSETVTNSLPDDLTQLLLEAEHAIQNMDCISTDQSTTADIMNFPKVGMGHADDIVESCVRTSMGEPPLVTVRPYERHWKRSGVYQWRKPPCVISRENSLVNKPKSVRRKSRIIKNSAGNVKVKQPRITVPHPESGLLDLPNELIHLILSYLPLSSLLSTSTTCKRLSLLANNSPFLYSNLNLSRLAVTSENLNWIISKQPKHLDLSNSTITLTDPQIQLLVQSIVPQLHSLSLYPGTPYSLKGDQICNLLSQHDTQYLSSLHLNWIGVTDYGLSCLLSISTLSNLSLTGSNHITDKAVIPLIIKFQSTLTDLDLSSCIQLTNRTGYVVATCVKLSSLGLATCYKMTDKVFKLILASLPLLQSLDLHSNPGLAETDSGVLEGLTNCNKLKRLNLCHATNITDSHISHLLARLPMLTHLYVGNCKLTDKFVTSLCQARLANLSHLDLSGLPISSLSLSAIATAYQLSLTSLVLNSCIRITQNSICKLMDKCRRLETISVFDTKINPVPRYQIKSKVKLIGTTPLPVFSRNLTL